MSHAPLIKTKVLQNFKQTRKYFVYRARGNFNQATRKVCLECSKYSTRHILSVVLHTLCDLKVTVKSSAHQCSVILFFTIPQKRTFIIGLLMIELVGYSNHTALIYHVIKKIRNENYLLLKS